MPNIFPVGPDAHETKEFQPAVKDILVGNGWYYYHTHDSRGSDPGMLDVFAVNNYYLLIA